MKRVPIIAVAAVIVMAASASFFLISCTSMPGTVIAPLEIPDAHFVGNQVCSDCHMNITRQFASSPHAHLTLENNQALPGGAGCESCHGPGSKHVEAGGGLARFIINPGNEPQACLRCHTPVQAEFELPAHHPVLEGHMHCGQCHDPHGRDILKPSGGLAMARLNEDCAQCHREQTRPFVFEHPALREGCVVCHNPHGSINRGLLTQADNNLCFRCHSQVQASGAIFIGQIDHTTLLPLGTCWSAGCHTAVHGSDVDPRLRY